MNITSPKVVKALMEQYSIAPLKKYGQNFLIDGNIADKIADAAMPENAYVLEIGPGLGALTSRLVEKAASVAAFEIDAGLVGALKSIFKNTSNLTIFHQDFLKADLQTSLLPLFADRQISVAANLPYYITSPCIMKLMTAKLNINRITVMVQKEVAERICANPGSKDYGAISAAIRYFATSKMLFTVSPTCFFPKPDVTSAVISLEIQPKDEADTKAYLDTVKGLFAMRRKTVKSNLRQVFSLSQNEAGVLLEMAEIDENARAEMLSVNDFLRISQILKLGKKLFQ